MAQQLWTGAASDGNWGSTGNWLSGSVPSASDDVFFQNNAISVTAGLDQHTIALNSLNIAQTYTGTIGSTTAYLQIQASTVIIGAPGAVSSGTQSGVGSGRIMLNLGSGTASTIVIVNTALQSVDAGLEPVRIIGTNASNTLSVQNGRVGIATNSPADVATFATVNVSGVSNSNAVCDIGAGVTLTTVNCANGGMNIACAMTTLNVSSTGSQTPVTTTGSGAITTATVGGYVNFRSTGTITTLNVSNGGTADFSGDPRAKTVTNCNLYTGATLNENNGNPLSITFTNGRVLSQCGINDVSLNFGNNHTVKIS